MSMDTSSASASAMMDNNSTSSRLLDYSKHRARTATTAPSNDLLDESSRHSQASFAMATGTTCTSSSTTKRDSKGSSKATMAQALSTTEMLLSLPLQHQNEGEDQSMSISVSELEGDKSLSCSDRLRLSLRRQRMTTNSGEASLRTSLRSKGNQKDEGVLKDAPDHHQQETTACSDHESSRQLPCATTVRGKSLIQFELKRRMSRTSKSITKSSSHHQHSMGVMLMTVDEEPLMDVSSSAHRLHKSLLAQLGQRSTTERTALFSHHHQDSITDHTRRKDSSSNHGMLATSLEDSFGSLSLDLEMDMDPDISDVWDHEVDEQDNNLAEGVRMVPESLHSTTFCIKEEEEDDAEQDSDDDQGDHHKQKDEKRTRQDLLEELPALVNAPAADSSTLMPVPGEQEQQTKEGEKTVQIVNLSSHSHQPKPTPKWTSRPKTIADLAGSWNQRNQPELLPSTSSSSSSKSSALRPRSLSPLPPSRSSQGGGRNKQHHWKNKITKSKNHSHQQLHSLLLQKQQQQQSLSLSNHNASSHSHSQPPSRSPSTLSFSARNKLDKLNASTSSLLNESTHSLLEESFQRPSVRDSLRSSATSSNRDNLKLGTDDTTNTSSATKTTTTTGNHLLDSLLRNKKDKQKDTNTTNMTSSSSMAANSNNNSHRRNQNAQWNNSNSHSDHQKPRPPPKASVFSSKLATLASLTNARASPSSGTHAPPVVSSLLQSAPLAAMANRTERLQMIQAKLASLTANSPSPRHVPPPSLIQEHYAQPSHQNAQWRSRQSQPQHHSHNHHKKTKRSANPFWAIMNSPVGVAGNSASAAPGKTVLTANDLVMDDDSGTADMMLFNKRSKVQTPDGKVASISRSSSMASTLASSLSIDDFCMTKIDHNNDDHQQHHAKNKTFVQPQQQRPSGSSSSSQQHLSSSLFDWKGGHSQHRRLGGGLGSSSHHRRHHPTTTTTTLNKLKLQPQNTSTRTSNKKGFSSAVNLDQMAAMISRSSAAKLYKSKRKEGSSSSRANLMSDSIFNDPSHFVTGSRIRRYQSSGTLAFLV